MGEIWGALEVQEANCGLIQYWEIMLLPYLPFVKIGEGRGGLRGVGGGQMGREGQVKGEGWGGGGGEQKQLSLWDSGGK